MEVPFGTDWYDIGMMISSEVVKSISDNTTNMSDIFDRVEWKKIYYFQWISIKLEYIYLYTFFYLSMYLWNHDHCC